MDNPAPGPLTKKSGLSQAAFFVSAGKQLEKQLELVRNAPLVNARGEDGARPKRGLAVGLEVVGVTNQRASPAADRGRIRRVVQFPSEFQRLLAFTEFELLANALIPVFQPRVLTEPRVRCEAHGRAAGIGNT